MSVKYPLDLNRVINYSGVMDANALQKTLDDFFMSREYDRYDETNKYLTTKKGRVIEIKTRYEKQYSDDDIFEITCEIKYADLVPITVKVDSKDKKLEKGRVKISFETFMKTNETGRWGGSPIKMLFQYISAFHIFKHHLDNFKEDAKRDTNQLHDMLIQFLNGSK